MQVVVMMTRHVELPRTLFLSAPKRTSAALDGCIGNKEKRPRAEPKQNTKQTNEETSRENGTQRERERDVDPEMFFFVMG